MYLLILDGLADLGSDMALVLWNEKTSVQFSSIQFNLFCVPQIQKGVMTHRI